MYFLLKNGDIPASYVSLPEGLEIGISPEVHQPGCIPPVEHLKKNKSWQPWHPNNRLVGPCVFFDAEKTSRVWSQKWREESHSHQDFKLRWDSGIIWELYFFLFVSWLGVSTTRFWSGSELFMEFHCFNVTGGFHLFRKIIHESMYFLIENGDFPASQWSSGV